MADGFYHKNLIFSLRNEFVKGFISRLPLSLRKCVYWEFPNKDLSHSFTSGLGDKQIKIINTVFFIAKKRIPIDFLEDFKGNLTIAVNSKPVWLVKSMERITVKLIKTLAESIRSEYEEK